MPLSTYVSKLANHIRAVHNCDPIDLWLVRLKDHNTPEDIHVPGLRLLKSEYQDQDPAYDPEDSKLQHKCGFF